MADHENKIRDAADAVKGIVEAVPVYQDALQPAAKEIGTALQTVTRAIHVALAPISALVWGYDKIQEYLAEALSKKLRDIPPEQIITPNPMIAGPVLVSLQFAAHEPSLRELYANLLATSMDEATARNAHPAFVEIIRQLTPDEARIIELLDIEQAFPTITVGVGFELLSPGIVQSERLPHFSTIAEQAGCSHPDLYPAYLNNLCRLGLVEIKEGALVGGDAVYKALQKHPTVIKFVSAIETEGIGFAASRSEFIQLTALGLQFCRACVVRGDSSIPAGSSVK